MTDFKLPLAILMLTGLIGCEPRDTTEEGPAADYAPPVTLFVAAELITMSDSIAEPANAVAVQNGKILEVGDRGTLEKKFSAQPGFAINDDYRNNVIAPGFVEPHLHLWLAGILMGTEFITPADWHFPDGLVQGIQSQEAYMSRLIEVAANHPEGEPLVTWGYHQYFHGQEMSRSVLDEISPERPIVVWHRSFHELYFNTAALEMFGWTEEFWNGDTLAHQQLIWEKGHAFEAGGKIILPDVLAFLLEQGTFARGMERTRQYVHAGGITTAIDPGVIISPEMYEQMVGILTATELPMEYWLIPGGNFTYAAGGYDAAKGKAIAEAQVAEYAGVGNIQWLPKFIKLFADGAMYSQLMQLKDGYIDGHDGEWIQTPEELEESMRPYWNDDYTVIVHVNGDEGLAAAIDIVETMNAEYPRDDHRTGYHHLGIIDPADIPRVVAQGSNFSVNPYYTHILAENYVENGVGSARAEVMSRGRSIIDAGGLLSLHSDALMAPAEPLAMVWAAVNRIGLSGETVMGEGERVTVDEAMRGITIDAAYVGRMEDRVGSIDVGKDANFAVLDASPYTVAPEAIKDIGVEATIFKGRVFPVPTP
ncbi:MAG: amidohydrolase [Woeseiaceae bacterium]